MDPVSVLLYSNRQKKFLSYDNVPRAFPRHKMKISSIRRSWAEQAIAKNHHILKMV